MIYFSLGLFMWLVLGWQGVLMIAVTYKISGEPLYDLRNDGGHFFVIFGAFIFLCGLISLNIERKHLKTVP